MGLASALAEVLVFPLWNGREWTLGSPGWEHTVPQLKRMLWETSVRGHTDLDATQPIPSSHQVALLTELGARQYYADDLLSARASFKQAQHLLLATDCLDQANEISHARVSAAQIAALLRMTVRAREQDTPMGELNNLPEYKALDCTEQYVLKLCRAAASYQRGLFDDCAVYLEEAEKLCPREYMMVIPLRVLQGIVKTANGDYRDAICAFRDAQNWLPKGSAALPAIQIGLGNAYLGLADEANKGLNSDNTQKYQTQARKKFDTVASSPLSGAREVASASLNRAILSAASDPTEGPNTIYEAIVGFPGGCELQIAHGYLQLGMCYEGSGEQALAEAAYSEASARYRGVNFTDFAVQADIAAAKLLERQERKQEALDRLLPAALVKTVRSHALTGVKTRQTWRDTHASATLADAIRLARDVEKHDLVAELIAWARLPGQTDLVDRGPIIATPRTPVNSDRSVLKPGPWVVSGRQLELESFIDAACERYGYRRTDFHTLGAITLQPIRSPVLPRQAATEVTLVNRTQRAITILAGTRKYEFLPAEHPIDIDPEKGVRRVVEHDGCKIDIVDVDYYSLLTTDGATTDYFPPAREDTYFVVPQVIASLFASLRSDLLYPAEVNSTEKYAKYLGRIVPPPER